MNRLILLFITCIAFVSSEAQNVVYDANAEVRQVAPFTGIDVSGTVALYLSQGTSQGVAVSAGDEKYNSKIKTEVRNGILHISVEGGMWNGFNWTNKKLKAYVTATDLQRLEVSGASFVSTTAPIKSDDLKLEVSGASEVKAAFDAGKMNLQLSGASVVKLSGTVKDGSIDASGASKLTGYELVVDNLKVTASGASNVRVTAAKELEADASGASTVYYKGAASKSKVMASAGATVKNKGDNDD